MKMIKNSPARAAGMLNRLAEGLHRFWSDLQSNRYDRHLMVVGVMEALGFLLAAFLAGGATSGCYAISGECVGGCKDKDAASSGAKDVVDAKDTKGGEVSSVDAGPQATYPDGADAGICYADVCIMPKECPTDAPPVCWWLCPKFKKKWKFPSGGVIDITYREMNASLGYCVPGKCYIGAYLSVLGGWCIDPGDNGPSYVKPAPPAPPEYTLTFEDDGSFTTWCASCPEKTHFTNIE